MKLIKLPHSEPGVFGATLPYQWSRPRFGSLVIRTAGLESIYNQKESLSCSSVILSLAMALQHNACLY